MLINTTTKHWFLCAWEMVNFVFNNETIATVFVSLNSIIIILVIRKRKCNSNFIKHKTLVLRSHG